MDTFNQERSLLGAFSVIMKTSWIFVSSSSVCLHGDSADGDADAGEGLQGRHGQQEESQHRHSQACNNYNYSAMKWRH